MRQLMDALEANESIPLPYHGRITPLAIYFNGLDDARRRLATAARAIPCKWSKTADDKPAGSTAWLEMDGVLGALRVKLLAVRDDVCERVVLGTEEREVEEVVRPAETRTITKPVEVVEWRCHPIMSALDGES